jgi:hypothetical protein
MSNTTSENIELLEARTEDTTQYHPLAEEMLSYFDREIQNIEKQIELMQSPLTEISIEIKTKALLSLNEKLGYLRTHRNTVEALANLHQN